MTHFIAKILQTDSRLANSKLAIMSIFVFSAALCGYWLFNPAEINLLMPDSTSYIEFQPYRGAGYPFFLHILLNIGFSLENIIIIQTLLFFSALCLLAYCFNQRFNSLALSLALIIAIGMNPAIVRYCFTIITESVYFTSLFIFLAVIVSQSYSKPIKSTFLIGLLFCWLILIKPVSWAFIAVPVFVFWQHLTSRKTPIKVLLSITTGFLIMYAAGTAYRYHVHQQTSENSFLGGQLIGKLAFAEFNPDQTKYPEAAQLWQEIMQPSITARSEYMSKHYERFLFALNTYDFLRFTNMPAIVEKIDVPTEEIGQAQQELAVSIIKQNPSNYAYDVGLNFYNLWAVGEVQHTARAESYNAKLKQAINRFGEEIPTPYFLTEGENKAYILKPSLFAMFIANFAIMLFGLYKHILRFKPLSAELSILFTLACSVNAYFLLTALLQAALTRYAMVGWPLHLIILFASALLLFRKIDRQ